MMPATKSPISSLFRLLTVILLLIGTAHADERCANDLSADEAFRKGADLAELGRFGNAIPCFLIAYQVHSENAALLWNLAIASAEVGRPNDALKYWLAYRSVDPADWRSFPKLIQTYQALADWPARDKEREKLLELRRKAAEGSGVRRAEYYCREQAVIEGRKLLAFEMFEPRGERPVFYFATVLDESGREAFRISLGSYELTNRIAHETGNLPKEKRLYHLDRYDPTGHTTYAFYDDRPTYEQFRANVQAVLAGTMKPLSSIKIK